MEKDVISRQTVLCEIKRAFFSEEFKDFRVKYGSNGVRDYIINFIENLPSKEESE